MHTLGPSKRRAWPLNSALGIYLMNLHLVAGLLIIIALALYSTNASLAAGIGGVGFLFEAVAWAIFVKENINKNNEK